MLAQFAQAFSRASPFRRGGESMEQARSLVACDQWTTHAHSLGSGACADGARPAPRSLPVRGHRSAMSQVLTRIRDARSNVAWVIVTPGGVPSRRGVRNWPTGTTTPSERRKPGAVVLVWAHHRGGDHWHTTRRPVRGRAEYRRAQPGPGGIRPGRSRTGAGRVRVHLRLALSTGEQRHVKVLWALCQLKKRTCSNF